MERCYYQLIQQIMHYVPVSQFTCLASQVSCWWMTNAFTFLPCAFDTNKIFFYTLCPQKRNTSLTLLQLILCNLTPVSYHHFGPNSLNCWKKFHLVGRISFTNTGGLSVGQYWYNDYMFVSWQWYVYIIPIL